MSKKVPEGYEEAEIIKRNGVWMTVCNGRRHDVTDGKEYRRSKVCNCRPNRTPAARTA